MDYTLDYGHVNPCLEHETWISIQRTRLINRLKLKCHLLYLNHLQKFINNHEAKWTYFAKYWIGLHLRKLNPSFASNNFPHSEYVPIFYEHCTTVLDSFLQTNQDLDFNTLHKKLLYKTLLQDEYTLPKLKKTLVQILILSPYGKL